jgi:hypothetical protein
MAERTSAAPVQLGLCTECGRAYPVQAAGDHGFQPVGTDGRCLCGCREFVPITDDDSVQTRRNEPATD